MTDTLQEVVYTAEVTVTGGREGHVVSSDGNLDLALQRPARPGSDGGGTNPEQLFAAGYAACFQSALAGQARSHGIDASKSSVVAKVSLGKTASGSFGLAVSLDVTIPGAEQNVVEDLVAAAHQVCPYSRATRGNIEVTLQGRGG